MTTTFAANQIVAAKYNGEVSEVKIVEDRGTTVLVDWPIPMAGTYSRGEMDKNWLMKMIVAAE